MPLNIQLYQNDKPFEKYVIHLIQNFKLRIEIQKKENYIMSFQIIPEKNYKRKKKGARTSNMVPLRKENQWREREREREEEEDLSLFSLPFQWSLLNVTIQ